MIDVDENELLSLLPEDEEYIKNIIYEKYKYLIDIIIYKYHTIIYALQIDEEDVRCEAYYGFSDGIKSFRDNKNASLKTFLTLCTERRVLKYINSYTTGKAKILNNALSLDNVLNDESTSFAQTISDSKFDPLMNMTNLESCKDIIKIAYDTLSKFEYTVFKYLIRGLSYQEIAKKMGKTSKQIDNTIQRIKKKLRTKLKI